MEETIKIPVEEYKRLKQRDEFLRLLEAAGVDNWEGYSQAIESEIGDDE